MKKEDIISNRTVDQLFHPKMDSEKRDTLYRGWKKAVERSVNWIEN